MAVEVPIGTILTFAGPASKVGNIAPAGSWKLCDGSAIGRQQYSALYNNVVGDFWGVGDGITTFNLPDLRGYFLRGVDHGSGVDHGLGQRYRVNGAQQPMNEVGSYQSEDIKAHNHALEGGGYILGDVNNTGPTATNFQTGGAGVIKIQRNTANSGGTETHPVNAYVNFVIRVI